MEAADADWCRQKPLKVHSVLLLFSDIRLGMWGSWGLWQDVFSELLYVVFFSECLRTEIKLMLYFIYFLLDLCHLLSSIVHRKEHSNFLSLLASAFALVCGSLSAQTRVECWLEYFQGWGGECWKQLVFLVFFYSYIEQLYCSSTSSQENSGSCTFVFLLEWQPCGFVKRIFDLESLRVNGLLLTLPWTWILLVPVTCKRR